MAREIPAVRRKSPTYADPMPHTLTTARLTLTPVRPDDHAALLAHWTAPEVRRYLFDDVVLTPADITAHIAESQATFATAAYGTWTLRTPPHPTLLGTAALRPLDDLGLELVYSLAPEAWGHGYATEAAQAVVTHAFETLELPHLLAEIDEPNTASTTVVTRLGMTPYDTVPGTLGPLTRYRLLRP